LPLWKPAAIADRKRITQYIAKDNTRAAIEIGDMLMQKAKN
jgi:plasmid stabilization system protein ParE